MASLNRVTGKVFAGEADLENIGIFGSAKAGTPTNNTDVATIQGLSAYLEGWTDAVVTSKNFPPVEEVNGALKTISYQACYCLQEGIAEYDNATEYKANSFCKVNNTIYYSLKNNNINHNVTDNTWWGVCGDNRFIKKSGDTMTGALTLPVLSSTDNSLKAATTQFVRQWAYGNIIKKDVNIITANTSLNDPDSTDIIYNLGTTGYLPANYSTYPYEVYLSIEGVTGTSTGNYITIALTSELVGTIYVTKARCTNNGQQQLCSWGGWFPIGTNGRLILGRSSDWNGYVNVFRARAYRKLN